MHIERFNIYYACGSEGWRIHSLIIFTDFTLWSVVIFSSTTMRKGNKFSTVRANKWKNVQQSNASYELHKIRTQKSRIFVITATHNLMEIRFRRKMNFFSLRTTLLDWTLSSWCYQKSSISKSTVFIDLSVVNVFSFIQQ